MVDYFIRAENLEEDFDKIFNTNINDAIHYRSGVGNHLPYKDYYNKDLMDLVYQKDNYIFKKFNYKAEI